MKRLLKEPLLHFVLLGAAIFAVYGLASKRTLDAPDQIVVTQGQIERLAAGFARTWQRPPTDEELEGLIQDYIREEVYSREALDLGLDRDDTIIRRRLRQKMEFVSEDIASQTEPTEDDLRTYLTEHPEAFRVERRFTFGHVYLNPERRGENLDRDAALLLAQLNQAGSDSGDSALGDPFLLEHKFEAVPASEVAAQFGESFTAQLGELPTGLWQGPVESGFGFHLIFIGERTEGRVPGLEEVRDAVHREWANVKRLNANELFYQEFLKRYAVTIERPMTPGADPKLAAAITE